MSRICGGADLKQSQHYPRRFGMAISELFLEHYEMISAKVKDRRKELKAKTCKEAKDRYGVSNCLGEEKLDSYKYKYIYILTSLSYIHV